MIDSSASPGSSFEVTRFGAVGDGKTLCTEAIQRAIDAAGAARGGTVFFPAGTYLTGTIALRDGITLDLHPAATILGSPDLDDYTEHAWGQHIDRTPWHLIGAHGCRDITLTGGGTIDGNGPAFWEPMTHTPGATEPTPLDQLDPITATPLRITDPAKAPLSVIIAQKERRPSPMIEISGCTNVRVTGIHITNSAGWNLHLHNCRHVHLHGVKLTSNMHGPNNDGFDITGCRDVLVSDCYLSCCDDAICLKTTPDSWPCERVTITNCIIRTHCVAVKFGCAETFHDFRQVTISNLVVYESNRAIGIYSLEGATVEDVTITNIVCDTKLPTMMNRAIHIDCRRKRPESKLGVIRNITISNVVCRTDGRVLLTGQPESPLRNITLRDIQLVYPTVDDPAIHGRTLGGAQFSNANPDARAARAAVVAENVDRLVIENLSIEWPRTDGDGVMSVPDDWRFAIKNANGVLEFFERDAFCPGDILPPMHALWGRGLSGGYARLPLADASSPDAAKLNLDEASTITVEGEPR